MSKTAGPARTPLFEENAGATLARCQRVFRERGDEYGDTWRHSQHLMLRAVFKELTGEELAKEFCIPLAAAVFCDVKYQRNEGGYKEDSLDDGINYMAFLAEAMRKVRAGQAEKCATCGGSGIDPADQALMEHPSPCPTCRPRIAAPSLSNAVPARGRSV